MRFLLPCQHYMEKKTLYILLLFSVQLHAQFKFSGTVSEDYQNATAYLSVVDNYNKTDLFITEQIIQESKIDANGYFIFEGDFLNAKNKFYNIHIDKCSTDINDFRHALNHCEDSHDILFIANNSNSIQFPLNNLAQVFCDIQSNNNYNNIIRKVDSLEEVLLTDLQYSKSDAQRKIIYGTSFRKLQQFSNTFNEPLAELYAFQLYSSNKSIYNRFFQKDLKTSEYYLILLNKLKENYPKSTYSKQFEEELKQQQYLFIKKEKNTKMYFYILCFLLICSIILNLYLYKRQYNKKAERINYTDTLSPQEQKVFEYMHQKLTNKEIASTLFISVSTVKTHINNIYTKLNIIARNEVDSFF